MKIFLDEPLIDWQRNAHMQSKNMRPTASSSGADGTPQSAQQPPPRMDVDGFAQLQLQVANLKLGMYARYQSFLLAASLLLQAAYNPSRVSCAFVRVLSWADWVCAARLLMLPAAP